MHAKEAFLAAALMVGALISLSAHQSQAQTVLRVGAAGNKDFAFAKAVDESFVPAVAKATNNCVTVQTFWGNQLGSLQENVGQTRNGTIFATTASTAYFNTYVQELDVVNLPFLFSDRETAFRVFDGPLGQELAAKLLEKGFVVLGYFELGFRQLTNRSRPITSPDGLKGLKIRVQPNPVHLDTFRLLGANPIQIDVKELFEALRQGVVDGQENPYVFIDLLKYHEAGQKYVSDTGHFYDIMLFVASKRLMDELSATDRQAIMKAGAEATAYQRRVSGEMNATGRERMLKNGYQFTQLTPAQREAFRQRSAPIYKQIEDKLGKEFVARFVKAAGK